MQRNIPWRSPTLLTSSSICSFVPEADVGKGERREREKLIHKVNVGIVYAEEKKRRESEKALYLCSAAQAVEHCAA